MTEQPSQAELYVQKKAWEYRSSSNHMVLEICPITQCDNWHFYMVRGGEKDGVWDCKKCGQSGNLFTLRQHLGDKDDQIQSQKEWAQQGSKKDPLPDADACHARLIADEEAMEYLFWRGFTLHTVQRQKLGLTISAGRKWLVIPYLNKGQVVYAKYRRIPPVLDNEKRFSSPHGWEAPLYNEETLVEGLEDIVFVEGELNAVALINQSIYRVVGVPGANSKKADWIIRLDNAKPKQIYMLYDNDKVGQDAAEEMARRIALNSSLPVPHNIKLPEFEKEDGTPGKDINEWFKAGNTKQDFELLKQAAIPFEVRHVVSMGKAIDEMETLLEGKEGLTATYVTHYPDLNEKLGGFEKGDVIDVIAKAKIGKTTLVMNLLDQLIAKHDETGLNICFEMPNSRWARKWVSHVTQTDDSPAINNEDAMNRLANLRKAIPIARQILLNRKGDLLLANPSIKSTTEVYDIIRQSVRRYDAKFVVIDNIQFLADLTLHRLDQRTIHISQISKRLKDLASELNIVMFRIIQPNKGGRRGEIVDHNDADGSSQLSKDCDLTLSLHRNQKATITEEDFARMGNEFDVDTAMEPEILIRVISRYAPGGVCVLMMEGGTSTVRSVRPEERGVKAPIVGSQYPVTPMSTVVP